MRARRIKAFEIAAAAFIAVMLASSATAEEPSEREERSPGETVAVQLDISGIDLASPAGAARLHRDIAAAATRICRASVKDYAGVQRAKHVLHHVKPCVQGAVEDALAQITETTGLDIEQVAAMDGRTESELAASR